MGEKEKAAQEPTGYIGWALSVLREFYVVIDVDSAEENEAVADRYKTYLGNAERVA